MCWVLKDLLNKASEEASFALPGTHGTFYPWVPPPGLSEDILFNLRQELIRACRKSVGTHSRQSSAGSAEGEREYPRSEVPDIPVDVM